MDLHPAGALQSVAQATTGTQQVGSVYLNGIGRASLWSGTAASWVDLNPAGLSSEARGIHSGQQVGWAFAEGEFVASLWTGSASSWVNLNPPGSIESFGFDVYAGQQVGYAVFGTLGRAVVWSGTAASWQDLSQVLGASWRDAYATSIWSDQTATWVVGAGYNLSTGRHEALLWMRLTAAPCYANCDGSTTAPVLNVLDFVCFIQRFAAADPYANCDGSTEPSPLNVNDFICFQQRFAAGCP